MKIRIKTGVNIFIERGREKFELEHTLYVYTQLDVILMSEELLNFVVLIWS